MNEPNGTRNAARANSRAVIVRAYGAMVASNVLLAFGPWFVRLADVSPLASGFWRLALAVPLLLALTRIARQPLPRISPRLLAILMIGGICFAVDLGAWHVGILHTKLANAALFGNLAAFLLPLCGFIAATRLPGRLQGAAMLLALIGTVLLLGRSYELSARYLRGDLLCIMAGIFYTGYFLAMGRARGAMQPLPALFVSTLAGSVPLLLFAIAEGGPLIPHIWWPVIALAVGSQVIGQGLMMYALGHLSPLVMGLGLLIQPFFAAAIGSIRYGEPLGLADIAGGLAICVALVLVRASESGQARRAQLGSDT